MDDCAETLEELHRFLDKELPAATVTDIMEHLATCSDCQPTFEFHAELKRIISEKAQRDEMPPGLLDRVMACFGDVLAPDETPKEASL